MDNEHMCTVDPNGSSYLSHKFRPKYYKKIRTSKGTRYFYSEKEYQAYLDNQQPMRSIKKPTSNEGVKKKKKNRDARNSKRKKIRVVKPPEKV